MQLILLRLVVRYLGVALLPAILLMFGSAGLTAHANQSCAPLDAHTRLAKRHGQNHWSDVRLRVSSSVNRAVLVPQGWQAVGAVSIEGDCAIFPKRQAVVMIKTDDWLIEHVNSSALGIDYRLFVLKNTAAAERRAQQDMVTATFREVATLFPLGLAVKQRYPLDILVTTNVAGDNKTMKARIFPEPGPRLVSLFYDPKNPRGKDLLIHTTSHLYNKRRPRLETTSQEKLLTAADYREYVATWAEFAFNHNHNYVSRRLNLLLKQHQLVTDGSNDTWPSITLLQGLAASCGPFGVPPFAPKGNQAAREYAHYYLSPLVLLGVEGYLATDAPNLSVRDMLTKIHSESRLGLMTDLQSTMPLRYRTILKWISGEARIPEALVRQGLIRLHSGANESRSAS